MRPMLFGYFLRNENVSTMHYQEISGDLSALAFSWGRSILRIVTNLNLPGLLMARYMVEQHWYQSFRRIHLFRRIRRRDRGGLFAFLAQLRSHFFTSSKCNTSYRRCDLTAACDSDRRPYPDLKVCRPAFTLTLSGISIGVWSEATTVDKGFATGGQSNHLA